MVDVRRFVARTRYDHPRRAPLVGRRILILILLSWVHSVLTLTDIILLLPFSRFCTLDEVQSQTKRRAQKGTCVTGSGVFGFS